MQRFDIRVYKLFLSMPTSFVCGKNTGKLRHPLSLRFIRKKWNIVFPCLLITCLFYMLLHATKRLSLFVVTNLVLFIPTRRDKQCYFLICGGGCQISLQNKRRAITPGNVPWHLFFKFWTSKNITCVNWLQNRNVFFKKNVLYYVLLCIVYYNERPKDLQKFFFK